MNNFILLYLIHFKCKYHVPLQKLDHKKFNLKVYTILIIIQISSIFIFDFLLLKIKMPFYRSFLNHRLFVKLLNILRIYFQVVI